MKSAVTKSNESAHGANTLFIQRKGADSFFSGTKQKIQSLNGNKPGSKPFLQPKLNIGNKNDGYEQEADRVANQVMEKSYPDIQRKESSEGEVQTFKKHDNFTPYIQQKPAFESPGVNESVETDEPPLQKKENDTTLQAKDVDPTLNHSNIESSLKDSRGDGEPLPDDTRAKMESGIGADFSGARIHTGEDAVHMNHDLNSQAFTSGNDIYFDQGKYNPDTTGGDHLLAHELTHMVQQGAAKSGNDSVQTKTRDDESIQKQENNSSIITSQETTQKLTPADISTAFKPNAAMSAYLDEKGRKRAVEVPVKIGKLARGNIRVRQTRQAKEGAEATYKIDKGQGLSFSGVDFLNPLRKREIEPVIALDAEKTDNITGFISLRIGNEVLPNPKSLIPEINKHLELLGLFGVQPLKVPTYENTVVNGIVTLKTGELRTTVADFLEASGNFGLVGERFTFELNTNIDLKGLAQGDFKIVRDDKGKFSGEGGIATSIKNVSGKVKASYIAGDVTILGTVGIESEKFSGSLTIMVAEKVKAKQTMMAELGVESLEEEKKKKSSPKKAKKKSKKNQVIIGWGTVKARITPWLEGTAKVGVDDIGQVTIVGKIIVPKEVELMEQKGKRVSLFELEIKAGYGIPVVGQVGLFASIEMFINAGFGPLVLRNVGFDGTYSTDPSVLQKFSITGTLGISAFAIIGLEAKAGVFVTIIAHDIKAGIKVTAAAGIKAYTEVTPVLEYTESKDPQGGKIGEAWLNGHFEAAAQLFLKLAGAFFVEIDAPWWSPVPDKTWDYPLGDVEYPIGRSMGIGGDVSWLIGSPEVPELKFSPVDFDADKFTSDIMADPPPGKGGGKGGEQKGGGKWEDKAQKGGKEKKPELKKDNKGLEGKKKEDPGKWPDEKRYMRALGEIGKIGDASKQAPVTFSVLDAKLKKIKQKYRINKINPKNKKDGSVNVFVKHAKQNNSKRLIEIKLMSEAERQKLEEVAKKDLETKQVLKLDPKSKTIKESDAKVVAAEVAGKHKVVESINVEDGKETWDYVLDIGDKKEKIKGNGKSDIQDNKISAEEYFKVGQENHKLSVGISNGKIDIMMASGLIEPLDEKIQHIRKYLVPIMDTDKATKFENELLKIATLASLIVQIYQTRKFSNEKEKSLYINKEIDKIALKFQALTMKYELPGIEGISNYESPPTHNPNYGPFISNKRASGVSVTLSLRTRQFMRGTHPNTKVSGLKIEKGYQKGHLLAASLGGSNDNRKNFAAQSRKSNIGRSGMDLFERAIRTNSITHDVFPPWIIEYKVNCNYVGGMQELQTWLTNIGAYAISADKLFELAMDELNDKGIRLTNAMLISATGLTKSKLKTYRKEIIDRLNVNFNPKSFTVSINIIQAPKGAKLPSSATVPNHQ